MYSYRVCIGSETSDPLPKENAFKLARMAKRANFSAIIIIRKTKVDKKGQHHLQPGYPIMVTDFD